MLCFCTGARFLCLYFSKGKHIPGSFIGKMSLLFCWKDLCWTSRSIVKYHTQRHKQIGLNQHFKKKGRICSSHLMCNLSQPWSAAKGSLSVHLLLLPHSHLIQCLGGSQLSWLQLDGKTNPSNHTSWRYVIHWSSPEGKVGSTALWNGGRRLSQ